MIHPLDGHRLFFDRQSDPFLEGNKAERSSEFWALSSFLPFESDAPLFWMTTCDFSSASTTTGRWDCSCVTTTFLQITFFSCISQHFFLLFWYIAYSLNISVYFCRFLFMSVYISTCQSILVNVGSSWSILVHFNSFGSIWYMGSQSHWSSWSILVHLGPSWFLVHIGPSWFLFHFDFWSILVHLNSSWSILVHPGSS